MTITILFTPSSPCPLKLHLHLHHHHHHHHSSRPTPPLRSHTIFSHHHQTATSSSPPPPLPLPPPTTTTTTTPTKAIKIDKSLLNVSEATSDTELMAAACLRVRTFYDFQDQSFGIQDHKKYLVEREYEALKERVAGKRTGFRRVSCINATLPLSQISNTLDDLCSFCKFSNTGEDRVVVGSLDLNQCLRLPDEITGMKPQGIGADFARAYLSNVCVAGELQRNGLGYTLIAKSKTVAEEWGISDLYVHVAVDNEPAKNLYLKSGFVQESDEPAWQARFLDRPRRLLLWTGLPTTYDL